MVANKTLQLIEEAYASLEEALQAHTEATLQVMEAREALDRAVAQAYAEGRINGRNKEEREAQARSVFPELFQALHEAELELARSKGELEGAKARVELARAFLEASKV